MSLKNVHTLVALFLYILFCFKTQAQETKRHWFYIATAVDGHSFYLDKKVEQLPNKDLRVWEKIVYPDNSQLVSLVEWDCAGKRFRRLQVAAYAPNGVMTGGEHDLEWQFVTPEAVSETLFDVVCRHKSINSDSSSKTANKSKNFAEIIVKKANLREEANPGGKVIRELMRGDKLLLVNAESIGGWYKVVDSKTKSEGWLHGNTFKVLFSNNKRADE